MKTQFENKLKTIKSSFKQTLEEINHQTKDNSHVQSKSHTKVVDDLKMSMEIREHQLLEEIDMLKDTMHKIVSSQNNEYENMLNEERRRFEEIITNMQNSRERDLEVEIKSRMSKFYNDKNEKVQELTTELNLQKEHEIAQLKLCTEQVISQIQTENKRLQKDNNQIKKELASSIIDHKKKQENYSILGKRNETKRRE